MKVSIVGITGYSGLELVRILNGHQKVELVSVHATKEIGTKLSDIYSYLKGICDLEIQSFDSQKIMATADLVFFATPSGVAKELAKDFIAADYPVIVISGDHRLPLLFMKNGIRKQQLNKHLWINSHTLWPN